MTTSRPARGMAAVALVLVGVFSLGAACGQASGGWRLPDWLVDRGGDRLAAGPALPPSRPVRIAVPSLDIEAPVHPVGLDRRGAIAAPPPRRAQTAGWYRDGPAPGQLGAAVIVGHVDDAHRPAVFHDLARARAGTRIEVTRRDRRVATFQVTDIRRYDKTALPADEVYGDFRAPELRLITCGGRWVGGALGYAENVVVFAVLVRAQ